MICNVQDTYARYKGVRGDYGRRSVLVLVVQVNVAGAGQQFMQQVESS